MKSSENYRCDWVVNATRCDVIKLIRFQFPTMRLTVSEMVIITVVSWAIHKWFINYLNSSSKLTSYTLGYTFVFVTFSVHCPWTKINNFQSPVNVDWRLRTLILKQSLRETTFHSSLKCCAFHFSSSETYLSYGVTMFIYTTSFFNKFQRKHSNNDKWKFLKIFFLFFYKKKWKGENLN